MVERLPGVALWSGISLGIWLLSLSSLSWGELVVGGACSLAVGVVTVAAQRAVGVRWAPTASSLRPVLAVPLAIVTDALQVVARPFRRPDARGRFERVDIDAAAPRPRQLPVAPSPHWRRRRHLPLSWSMSTARAVI